MKKYYRTYLIDKFIKKNNWSVTKFCKECKISLGVYKKIINQQLNFRLNSLIKIAKVMKIEICQICY